jgi:hypothetical protein
MRRYCILLCLLGLAFGSASHMQAQNKTEEQRDARFKAHKGDFDYLLGDWQFTAKSKEHGTFTGVWSAVRLPQGQILDEYRVLGDNGQTVYLTTTIRAYNAAADRWELVGMEEGNGLQDVGTGRRVGGEVHIEQKFGVTGANPSARRIRYYNIRPDAFSWASDRSPDGGKTWVKDDLLLEAKRIGPSRSQEPLTRVKGSSGDDAAAAHPRGLPR